MRSDEQRERLRRIVDEVLKRPADDRTRAIRELCDGDDALAAAVRQVVAAFDSADRHGADQTGELRPDHFADTDARQEAAGQRIGRYKLLQLLGEGGFGSVFMAEQTSPMVRRVALKVIKLGMDTRAVIARFEAERQALAMMDHPHIARVLDAGATESGRPYFVMDLVRGDPITKYCDKHQLTVRERLELFQQVCSAVQHAHQKGIIHRDLKPNNVLISTEDNRPHVKVIDFGIAKATSQRLTEKTLFTSHGGMIGTLEYMSPEQADGNLDVDTRSDVYSLGVLLYELLTGSTPLDRKRFESAAYGEMQRIIREEEPEKPSTRLSSTAESLASVAAHRRIEPKRLGSLVRGDLDWIVMKALEKERSRRYDSASGFEEDVQRYLDGSAVRAAPPSWSYRARKFARRYRGPLAAVAASIAILVAGVVTTTWQWRQARRNAVATATQMLEVERQRTALELKQKETAAILDFINTDVFGGAIPSKMPDLSVRNAIVEKMLAPAAAALEKKFKDQPQIRAAVMSQLGLSLFAIGFTERAEPLMKSALALRRKVLGDGHPDTALSMIDLARVYNFTGQRAEAEALSREAFEQTRQRLGPDDRLTLYNMSGAARQRHWIGDTDEARRMFKERLERSERAYGKDDPDTVRAVREYAELLDPPEGEPYYEEAVARARRISDTNEATLIDALNSYGSSLWDQGRNAEAEPLLKEVLERRRRAYGDNLETTQTELHYAGLLTRLHRFGEAEPLFRACIDRFRKELGNDSPATVDAMHRYAVALREEGRLSEALPLLQAVYDGRRTFMSEDRPQMIDLRSDIVIALRNGGRAAEAEPIARENMERARRVLGNDHIATIRTIGVYARTLAALGRPADAEPLFREFVDRAESSPGLGKRAVLTVQVASGYAAMLDELGRAAEAKALRERLQLPPTAAPASTAPAAR